MFSIVAKVYSASFTFQFSAPGSQFSLTGSGVSGLDGTYYSFSTAKVTRDNNETWININADSPVFIESFSGPATVKNPDKKF